MKLPALWPTRGSGLTLNQALERFELVDVEHRPEFGQSYLVMSDPNRRTAPNIKMSVPSTKKDPSRYSQGVDLRELGTTGTTSYGSLRQEYVPELMGVNGFRTYDKMKRSDARVRASLRMIKTPIMGARWFMQPASDSVRDKNVSDFVWECLTCYMSTSFPQLLWETLLMLDYGYYMFEKVWTPSDGIPGAPKGKIVWKKLAPRHPVDVQYWELDNNGGPNAAWMNGASLNGSAAVKIDIEKLLIFSFDKEAGNLEGLSLLRSAYKHWFYKSQLEKIDAIQKERHGIGIPIIMLPPNFSKSDKAVANEMGRNLRTNESAHVVLPPNWTIEFAKINGQPVDCQKSIEHHDRLIMTNILGEFLHSEGHTTGQAAQVASDVFTKSTKYIADIVADVINKWAIPQLVDYNYSKVGYPTLCARRIGDTVDWRTISFAMRNFVGAGLLTPDDPTEAWIRDEMDLPIMDPKTSRQVLTPQAPGAVGGDVEVPTGSQPADKPSADNKTGLKPAGPPRQTTAAKMKNNTGAKNTGTDRSG